MSTNQSRINASQSFIDFLMRKKQQEQQQGAWSERTGIPSIDNQLYPSAFPRQADAPSPQTPTINRGMNPMARVADMTPDAGMDNIQRPTIIQQSPAANTLPEV